MNGPEIPRVWRDTALTLLIGAAGALAGWAVALPIYLLLGPAIAVSLSGLAGLRTAVAPRLRDACFVLVGLAVGAGFTSDALGAMVRWPLAFAAMGGLIWLILVLSRWLLKRYFGFDGRSALLAAAPGHLSFVIAIASDTGADVARVSVTQSIRLLSLTLVVPFLAMLLGVDLGGEIMPGGQSLDPLALAVLLVLALVVARLFARWSVPAPLLMGAMVVSGLGHVTDLTEGVLPEVLIGPAYLVLGALIGTRFSGVTPGALWRSLGAGLAITATATLLSAAAALPLAWLLGMPAAHVLVGFAPGGIETMIAMGIVLGVMPGFVAACHITRLMWLSLLLPVMLARSGAAGAENARAGENRA